MRDDLIYVLFAYIDVKATVDQLPPHPSYHSSIISTQTCRISQHRQLINIGDMLDLFSKGFVACNTPAEIYGSYVDIFPHVDVFYCSVKLFEELLEDLSLH